MLLRKILAFVLGAAFASCWWSLAVGSGQGQGIAPVMGTIIFLFVAVATIWQHWDDE